MKRTMKTFLSLILVTMTLMSTTTFAANYQAIEPTFEVLVDGERFYSNPPIVVIDGRTYLPLRALGECLGIYVEWNAALSQVEVSSTKDPIPASYVENPYAKFNDVPDFGKVTGNLAFAEQSDMTPFGYATSYGYQISSAELASAAEKYVTSLAESGYEQWYYDDSQGYETLLLINESTGRMINILVQETVVVITIAEKTRSLEDWKLLDAGKTLPQKKFDAVTAGFKVMVDGEEFVSENPAVVIEDRTYLPLRAMGDCLGVFVDWDGENQTVIVKSE